MVDHLEPLVLASASPRRQAFLRAGGIVFEARPSGVDEESIRGDCPRTVAIRTAQAKAGEVAAALEPGRVVLAADTMVVVDGEVFNKPADRDEAGRMLGRLSGRTHTVVTALVLARAGGETLAEAVEAGVTFNLLSPGLIRDYIDSGEADDKAGAYGIQGLGSRFVAAVEGDLTCVIGLPLGRLRELLAELTGRDWFAGQSLRELVLRAYPDLAELPPACLDGIPG